MMDRTIPPEVKLIDFCLDVWDAVLKAEDAPFVSNGSDVLSMPNGCVKEFIDALKEKSSPLERRDRLISLAKEKGVKPPRILMSHDENVISCHLSFMRDM